MRVFFYYSFTDSSGCDLSAVISSLVQVILDPQVRTIRGFHCLIQKEWVALGHPFTKRLGHIKNQAEEQVSCPQVSLTYKLMIVCDCLVVKMYLLRIC